MTRQRAILHNIPAVLALLALGGLYVLLSGQFALGPRALVPGLILGLVLLLLIAVAREHHLLRRTVGFALLGVVTVAEVLSAALLVSSLLTPQRIGQTPHILALVLLRDATLLWVANILTFSFWYWELDGGGPVRRHSQGYASDDFVFPQSAREHSAQNAWLPHYVDYLFLAFCTSTAFSPTDTAVISIRAKLLMMAQALISLLILAIIAARAVNTL